MPVTDLAGNPAADFTDETATIYGEGAGGVRVSIAFNDPTLEEDPVWTDITANLVAGYEIERGREYELDQTDAGTATVTVKDTLGILDPTNTTGPYYTKLEPDIQIKIELWNPVTREWSSRFRGFIEDFDYELEPAQVANFLKITCYDIFGLMSSIEMQPGEFGDTPPTGSEGDVFFDNSNFQDRITQVMGNAGIPTGFYVVFSGNVDLLEGTYSPGENPMDVIQGCVDAEFPGVSNVYPDRFGRLAAHGRVAKFDPEGVSGDAGPDAWDWHHWKCGDGTAVLASISDTAQLRPTFGWNRGKSKLINSATAYPQGIADADIAGQLVKDLVSIGLRGIKSWSKENLLVDVGTTTGNSGNDECKLFATYYVTNYAEPRNRITALTFEAMPPDDPRAAANWDLLAKADISDRIDVTITNPGGGGFNLEPFFIEGVKESCEPLNGDYAQVTLTLDVSPLAYFNDPVGLNG